MVEYIYFVKCPNCEDEHFYFFSDAKDCAMGRLSQKPVITQTEVNRNDFGECTDSCDLGTVWSWEDMMNDVPADPEQTVFSKADTVDCASCSDPEFNALDNSIEPSEARKPIPADMSIDDLVEAMEENEDDVECKRCHELFDKSECAYDRDYGWLCSGCQRAVSEHGGPLILINDPIDESSSKLLIWRCFFDNKEIGTVEAATEEEAYKKMEQQYPEYPYGLYDGCAVVELAEEALNEVLDPREMIELEYPSLTVTLYGSKRDVDDWDEVEHTASHTYLIPKVEVATAIWENWITEEDVADVEGGLEALEDDAAWEQFLETHFDGLFEKYHAQILEYFKEEATEDFRERSQEEYQMDQLSSNIDRAYDEWRDERYFGESAQKPFLEEFDNAETHKANLIDCPECGTISYDMKEQYCTNCGLGL